MARGFTINIKGLKEIDVLENKLDEFLIIYIKILVN